MIGQNQMWTASSRGCRTNTDVFFRACPTGKRAAHSRPNHKGSYNRSDASLPLHSGADGTRFAAGQTDPMTRPLRVLHLEDETLDAELVEATLAADELA